MVKFPYVAQYVAALMASLVGTRTIAAKKTGHKVDISFISYEPLPIGSSAIGRGFIGSHPGSGCFSKQLNRSNDLRHFPGLLCALPGCCHSSLQPAIRTKTPEQVLSQKKNAAVLRTFSHTGQGPIETGVLVKRHCFTLSGGRFCWVKWDLCHPVAQGPRIRRREHLSWSIPCLLGAHQTKGKNSEQLG